MSTFVDISQGKADTSTPRNVMLRMLLEKNHFNLILSPIPSTWNVISTLKVQGDSKTHRQCIFLNFDKHLLY